MDSMLDDVFDNDGADGEQLSLTSLTATPPLAQATPTQSPAEASATQSAQKKKRKPGRPKKGDGCEAASWDLQAMETLLELRYDIMKLDFQRARNNSQVNAMRIALAATLSERTGHTFTYRQCQVKIQQLKKRHDEMGTAITETGNKPFKERAIDSAIRDYMDSQPGLANNSLFTTDGSGGRRSSIDEIEDDAKSEGEPGHDNDDNESVMSGRVSNPAQKRTVSSLREQDSSKKRKTQGECIETGLGALSDGVRYMGDAMSGSITSDGNDSRVILDAIEAQTRESKRTGDALIMLTERMNQLIDVLAKSHRTTD